MGIDRDDDLPYSFDLLYDLKTYGDLYDHLTGVCRRPISQTEAQILETMSDHGIPLPEGYNPPYTGPRIVDRQAAREVIGTWGTFKSPLQQEALESNPYLQAAGEWIETVLKAFGLTPEEFAKLPLPPADTVQD
ncbi:hypothetical protein ACYPKM_02420 [Pseudomonas aeruginosa]